MIKYRVSQKHGNSVTNSLSSLLWISIVRSNFKSHNIIMLSRVYLMKKVKDCKDVSTMSLQDEQWRRTSLLCLYILQFSCFTKYDHVCSQSINKQNVNIADETLKDISFLSRYHYTKSKKYLKRRYRIRHWIPMLYWDTLYDSSFSRNQPTTRRGLLHLDLKILQ